MDNIDYIAEQLRPLAVPVDSLILDPVNARRHPEKNLDAIKGSLRAYGQRKPVVVNRLSGHVEAGNGTLEAARSLGWSHVAALFVDDDPAQAAGFAIADNRTAELAEWDEGALAALLTEVRSDDDAIRQMMAELGAETKTLPVEVVTAEWPALVETVAHIVTMRYAPEDLPAIKRFVGVADDALLDPIRTGKAILERIKAVVAR